MFSPRGSTRLGRGILYIPVFLYLTQSYIFAEIPDSAIAKVNKNSILIQQISEVFDINPGYLSSIIYVERTLNYDWKDDALDIIIAKAGRNSSIGFCQVKLKTAYWIEVQLNDSSSIYRPGKEYSDILSVSQSSKELITKVSHLISLCFFNLFVI